MDAGLRHEAYDSEGPMPTQTVDFSDISPRLGVTYNINNDWQVMATWGKYVARLHDGQINNSTGIGSAPRITRQWYIGPEHLDVTGDVIDAAIADPANWALTTEYKSPEFPTTVLDPDLQSPYAREMNFAVKRALPNNTGTVTLTYTHRTFEDLIDDFKGGAYQHTVEIDPDGDGTPDLFDQKVWANNPNAIREYDGLALTFDYRPNTTWNIGGNYTWSRMWGNYEGEAGNQPGIGSALGDYPNSIPVAAASPTGYLAGDTPHRARIWGNYRLDFERYGTLVLGGLFRYSAGTPYSIQDGSVDVWVDDPAAHNDAGTTYRHYFDSTRGAHRFNSVYALDFSARYQIRVFKDLDAWAKLSFVNVLNLDRLVTWRTRVNAITDDNGVPIGYEEASGFGQATGRANYQVPRTVELTLGASWK